jgi:hypothetical protein
MVQTASLTPIVIMCLRHALRRRGRELPQEPTVRDVLLGVAAIGGHTRNNGDPAWIVIGRGFDKLLGLVEGYEAAAGSREM